MGIKNKNIHNVLSMYDIWKDDSAVYFEAKNMNGLFCCRNGEMKLLTSDPSMPMNQFFAYSSVVRIGDEIVSLPVLSKHIKIYNSNNKNIEYIELGEYGLCKKCVKYGDRIIMISNNGFLEFDIGEKRIVSYVREKVYYYRDVIIDDGIIYVPSFTPGRIIRYDIENRTIEIIIIPYDIRFSTIAKCGRIMYLSGGSERNLVLYDTQSGNTDYIQITSQQIKDNEREDMFSFSAVRDGNLLMFPCLAEGIEIINLKKYESEGYLFKRPKNKWCHTAFRTNADEIYIEFIDDNNRGEAFLVCKNEIIKRGKFSENDYAFATESSEYTLSEWIDHQDYGRNALWNH